MDRFFSSPAYAQGMLAILDVVDNGSDFSQHAINRQRLRKRASVVGAVAMA